MIKMSLSLVSSGKSSDRVELWCYKYISSACHTCNYCTTRHQGNFDDNLLQKVTQWHFFYTFELNYSQLHALPEHCTMEKISDNWVYVRRKMNLKQTFHRLISFGPINSYSNIYFFNQRIQDNIIYYMYWYNFLL